MKALNIKSGEMISIEPIEAMDPFNSVFPCWYANVEQQTYKSDWLWKVGCVHNKQTAEWSFKISEIGNVNDKTFWEKATGHEFAINLVHLFKSGGQKAVQDWVNQNRMENSK